MNESPGPPLHTIGSLDPSRKGCPCRYYTHSPARSNSIVKRSPIPAVTAPIIVRNARPNSHSLAMVSTKARSGLRWRDPRAALPVWSVQAHGFFAARVCVTWRKVLRRFDAARGGLGWITRYGDGNSWPPWIRRHCVVPKDNSRRRICRKSLGLSVNCCLLTRLQFEGHGRIRRDRHGDMEWCEAWCSDF